MRSTPSGSSRPRRKRLDEVSARSSLADALFEAYCHGYWPCGFTERYPARAPFLAMPLVR